MLKVKGVLTFSICGVVRDAARWDLEPGGVAIRHQVGPAVKGVRSCCVFDYRFRDLRLWRHQGGANADDGVRRDRSGRQLLQKQGLASDHFRFSL